ncbi:DUF2334 domain-containing protein [Candidatus Woesearchaeota archaeon]|nr:DUF2334 domain-containing protein [Candidatus Woesearchaeota archaeon]
MEKNIVVIIHDANPSNLSELEEITQELDIQGIKKRSIAVIPYYIGKYNILHNQRFLDWIYSEREKGNELIQHGYEHRPLKPLKKLHDFLINVIYAKNNHEFMNLTYSEAEEKIKKGKEILHEAEIYPIGFIAPCHFMTKEAEQAVINSGFEYTTFVDCVKDYKRNRDIYSLITGLDGKNKLSNKLFNIYSQILFKIWLRKKPLARFQIHPIDLKDEKAFEKALEIIKYTSQTRQLTTYSEFLNK